jgi:RNA recognition motif-containing protein
MMTKIYVGNLPYSVTEETLRTLFEPYGEIVSCKNITDYDTGRSKGFAFVEMATKEEASAAIEGLDGTELEGRTLRVNHAQDKKDGGGRRNRSFSSRRW